ncbi:MAG: histidine kinase [Burkholderiales bacterium RIFOXYC12_FULL_65_23]|uniref:sensor histidine kinase n=1 Tax=Malikia spinosa TaxID=86180 RepID=UPI0008C07497|nr:MAG: histidine kinase [Burkholderiales bacterium RIFOXYC12_FULL_65_23]
MRETRQATPGRRVSLRRQLMVGILLPVLLFVGFNTVVLYRQMLRAADTAYDRTLLATAKAIGEQLAIEGQGEQARLSGKLSYAALEAFEADNRSRLFYRVTGFAGEMVAGFPDLRPWDGRMPDRGLYAALVNFYDDDYQGVPVRVAVLLQPVSGTERQGMATIQVAETLELRQTLARQILLDTLWRQAGLVLVIAAVVVAVVHRVTRPVRALSAELASRPENDLRPLDANLAPREIAPLIEGANLHMARLSELLEHQKRFVRDSSHQLRTPLAVLKTQVQSALRGDVEPRLALEEIAQTVQGATELANQMLALAKVEQLRSQADIPLSDWAPIVHTVALDLSALVAVKSLDFELETQATPVRAHEWSLRELTRNLLHNAVRHSPPGGRLAIRLALHGTRAELCISDAGPGISAAQRERLFQPFSTDATDPGAGSGLGLAICQGIVQALHGQITLENRVEQGRISGLDARVALPLATPD